MINAIKKFLRCWNQPQEATAEELAEAEAMEQLLVKIRALEEERGYSFEYDLPDFYCIF